MTNQQIIQSKPLIDILDKISMGTDECLFRVLSGVGDDERSKRCKEHKNCRSCLQDWLAEEE